VNKNDNERASKEQDQKLKHIDARMEREREKRIHLVLEVEKDRKDRLVGEDNLKHTVNENLKAWDYTRPRFSST
jgi:hypothetical protein